MDLVRDNTYRKYFLHEEHILMKISWPEKIPAEVAIGVKASKQMGKRLFLSAICTDRYK